MNSVTIPETGCTSFITPNWSYWFLNCGAKPSVNVLDSVLAF